MPVYRGFWIESEVDVGVQDRLEVRDTFVTLIIRRSVADMTRAGDNTSNLYHALYFYPLRSPAFTMSSQQELQNPPSDAISCLRFSPSGT